MSLKYKDNNTTIRPALMKKLNSITDDCVLKKRKRKIYTKTKQSDPLEGKIMSIPPIVGKVDGKSGERSVDLEAMKKFPSSLKLLILHHMFV